MGMTATKWEEDAEFTAWLVKEGLRITGDECETRMCDLLWEAWRAGKRQGEGDERRRRINWRLPKDI